MTDNNEAGKEAGRTGSKDQDELAAESNEDLENREALQSQLNEDQRDELRREAEQRRNDEEWREGQALAAAAAGQDAGKIGSARVNITRAAHDARTGKGKDGKKNSGDKMLLHLMAMQNRLEGLYEDIERIQGEIDYWKSVAEDHGNKATHLKEFKELRKELGADHPLVLAKAQEFNLSDEDIENLDQEILEAEQGQAEALNKVSALEEDKAAMIRQAQSAEREFVESGGDVEFLNQLQEDHPGVLREIARGDTEHAELQEAARQIRSDTYAGEEMGVGFGDFGGISVAGEVFPDETQLTIKDKFEAAVHYQEEEQEPSLAQNAVPSPGPAPGSG